jgi:oligopeptide transport system ATP-binding protein
MKQLLQVKNLHVSFRSHGQILKAVQGVSFTLYEGEKLGIVGESGSGKSALVKALVKLNPSYTATIDEGEIWYQGQNLALLSEKELQKVRGKEIGMIFQDPMTSLNPTLQIGTQIAEGYLKHHPEVPKKQAAQRVLELLQLVGIPEPERRMHEYPHTLSGGIRQRAMIALALASQPKLLIADEPTTALDVTVQAQILSLMQEIQNVRSTILITHDLSVVAGFCDRILVMYAGKIVEDAPAEQLFSKPQHPYTQRLLQSIPRLDLPKDHPLIPIHGSPPDLTQSFPGCSFCARCSVAMNICRSETPPAYEIDAGHKSACWRHDPRRKP